MIKKITAFILVLNFALLLVSPISSKADDIIFGGTDVSVLPDATQLTNNSLDFFIGSLLNGATYDLTGVDSEYLADNFLYDVGSSVWEWLVYQGVTSGDANYNEDYTFTYLDNEGLENITTSVNLVPVSGSNHDRAKRWLQYLKDRPDTVVDSPTPDADYVHYINFINANRFDISGYTFSPDLNYSTTNIGCSVSNGNVSDNNNILDTTTSIIRFPYMNVFINEQNGVWTVTHTSYSNTDAVITRGWNNYNLYSLRVSQSNYIFTSFLGGWTTNYVNGSFDFLNGSFNSLTAAFEHVKRYYNKVNIYVNGDLWGQVGEPEVTHIPIGQTVIYPSFPVQPNFNVQVYFDPTDIIDRLQDLIDLKVVISYPDFEDLIVDVNGQRAFAVYNVVRNDYDNLVAEQFTFYPMFPTFQYHDEYNNIIAGGVQIMNVSASAVPDDLLDCLIYCGILILFGLVVRRFIE